MKSKLTKSAGAGCDADPRCVDEEAVLQDYALGELDPTQRAFADRMLAWAAELARVYKDVSATGEHRNVPQLRTWLGGSAGSGKSRTLKTIVQHMRLHF